MARPTVVAQQELIVETAARLVEGQADLWLAEVLRQRPGIASLTEESPSFPQKPPSDLMRRALENQRLFLSEEAERGGALAVAAAGLRWVVLVLPQNGWDDPVVPLGWSYVRNALLTVQGLVVAWLILRDASRDQDRLFCTIGRLVVVAFAFYLPVILLVHRLPMMGMLMTPKTLAYVPIAVVVYRRMYCRRL